MHIQTDEQTDRQTKDQTEWQYSSETKVFKKTMKSQFCYEYRNGANDQIHITLDEHIFQELDLYTSAYKQTDKQKTELSGNIAQKLKFSGRL